MQVQEFSNAASFLDRSSDLLFADELTNNLLLSSALALSRNGVARVPLLSFFTVFRETRAVASLLQSPNRRLILSTADESSARYLGGELSKRKAPLRGVFAPSAVAASFVEALEIQPKAKFTQNLMRLDRLADIEAADGVFRAARPKDLPVLVKWSHEFALECGLDETPAEAEEVVRKYVETKQLFVWESNGRPLAMAAYGGITPRAARISMVYTDRGHRNKKLALSLVHRLTHKLLGEGHEMCVLFVDAGNPVSNRVYEKLGFKTVASFDDYRFEGSRVTTTG